MPQFLVIIMAHIFQALNSLIFKILNLILPISHQITPFKLLMFPTSKVETISYSIYKFKMKSKK